MFQGSALNAQQLCLNNLLCVLITSRALSLDTVSFSSSSASELDKEFPLFSELIERHK